METTMATKRGKAMKPGAELLPAAARGGVELGSKAAAAMRPKPGALKTALAEFNREPMMDPKDVPLQTILWRVLVQPLTPLKTNAGGVIELPDLAVQAEEALTSVGYVLQLGHFAFKSKTAAGLALEEEPHKPAVGCYVVYQIYAGQEVKLRNGRKLRILLDTEILAIATNIDEIKNYI
jgi:co-chaperonin GroES (HSP10)